MDTASYSFLYQTNQWVIVTVLCACTIFAAWFGNWYDGYLSQKLKLDRNISTLLQTGLYGLLAFLLGFTFNLSASRLFNSREIINREANLIFTAIQRCDLFDDVDRLAFRTDLRDYLDARIDFYSKDFDENHKQACKIRWESAQVKLWSRAAAIAKHPGMMVPSNQMLPALNNMFEIVNTHNVNAHSRVPDQILWMLFILTVCSGFLVGFISQPFNLKSWIVFTVSNLLICLVVFIILDLDRPKRGLITTYVSDKVMVDLRHMLDDK